MQNWIEFAMFLAFAFPITVFDLKELRIPDALTMGGIAFFIILRLALGEKSFGALAAECILGFGTFWLIYRVTRGRMGLGDAKFSALIAVAVGLSSWFAALFIASVAALACVAVLIGLFGADRRAKIPFAPFLTLGASAAVVLKGFHGLIPYFGY